jgi:hypothetical protein
MVDAGTYQDEISELSPLSIKNYERIFKIFKSSISDKDFYVYNILKTIEFPTIDGQYLDHYTPESKMALSIVSYKVYKDIQSWWIIYLLNKDKFDGAPFYVDGGVQLKFIRPEIRSQIYDDITKSTIYGGKHF